MTRLVCTLALLAACGGGSAAPAKPAELPTHCELVVESAPSEADVSINGQAVGRTPFKRKLECQEIVVAITKAGYMKVEKSMTLVAGKLAVFQVALADLGGMPTPPPPL